MNYLQNSEQNHTTIMPNVGQEVEKARALQEVQGAIFMARQFPRNEELARKKILQTGKNLKFAESAIYAYPRGGSMIMGPSIRAAETMAKYWGNISYGSKILSQNMNENNSEIMTYCWDLETNVRAERVFKSAHIRETKSGNKVLTSNRDIYEKEANDSARRLRACILGIIPKEIIEELMDTCEETLVGKSDKTLQERIEEMVKKFEEIGITKEMIVKRMGVQLDKLVAKNVVSLGYIYNSIKENFAPASQFFDIPSEAQKQLNEAQKNFKNAGKSKEKEQYQPTQEELDEIAAAYYEDLANEQQTAI